MKRHRYTRDVPEVLWGGIALGGLLLAFLLVFGAPGAATIGLALLIAAASASVFLQPTRLRQTSKERLADVAEGVAAPAWVIAPDGRVLHANRRASDLVGSDPGDHLNAQSLFGSAGSEFLDALTRLLSEGRPLSSEAALRHGDGTDRPFIVMGAPLSCSEDETADAFLITAVEATTPRNVEIEPAAAVTDGSAEPGGASKGAEETPAEAGEAVRLPSEYQLRQSQKLEALTRLTGGLAHDLNNRLMVITASIDAVAKHMKDRPDLRRRLVAALVAADQANALISKLLKFAQQQEAEARYVDTAEQLASIATLLERSFPGHAVDLVLDVEEGLWPVKADPDRLETAIVNLAVGAREAMKHGGTVYLHARNTAVRRGSLSDPELSGEFVEIRVSEGAAGNATAQSGSGPQAVSAGHDPELGMSQVKDFARQLGGIVEITSGQGGGTAVSLFLPRSDLPARVGGRPRAEDLVEDEEEAKAVAEVLVVDDEEEVALAMQALLEQAGFATRVAIGAARAIEAIAAKRPDVVLTDVTMSGRMDGITLASAICDGDPTLPVILITGNPMVHAGECSFPVLNKPISSRDLRAAIQKQLQPPEERTIVPFLRKSPQ